MNKDFPSTGRENFEGNWRQNREVVQETEAPAYWNLELAQHWANKVPEKIAEKYRETPIRELDLAKYGYGKVLIKDESDLSANPTGTMKDRLAKDAVQDFAEQAKRILYEGKKDEDNIKNHLVRRYSLLTAGNAGMALARAFKTFGLPAPKLLLHNETPSKIIENLKKEQADIYLTNLGINPFDGKPSHESALTREQILKLTNNESGKDLTSARLYEASFRGYGKLAYSLFKKTPNEIYLPYGSGLLFENIVYNQESYLAELGFPRTDKTPDDKINAIRSLSILGAEPESFPSIADKLAAPAKPFVTFKGRDIKWQQDHDFTGVATGIYKISEASIQKAFEILQREGQPNGLRTEPSAAAGLALYMEKWENGLSDKIENIIIINTGRGLVSE